MSGASTDSPWGRPPQIGTPDLEGSGPYAPRFNELVRATESEMVLSRATGLVLGVIVDGKLAHSAAIGDLRRQTDTPMTVDAAFPVGLISELVTSLAVASAAEEGRLDLDATNSHGVTPHQLLTHSSGLGRADVAGLPIAWEEPRSLAEMFSLVVLPRWAPPGRVWNQNAFETALVALELEQATDMYFGDAVRTRVFNPLGMDGATYTVPDNIAFGHSGSGEVTPNQSVWVAAPSWGLHLTLEDLARLSETLMDQESGLLSDQMRRRVTAPHVDTQIPWWHHQGYGVLAWQDGDVNLLAASSGGGGGYSVQVVMAPDQKFGVIAMSNCDWYDLSGITYRAFDLFLDEQLTLAELETTPLVVQSELVGDFEDPNELGEISVNLGWNALSVRFDRWDYRTNLRQLAANVFTFDLSPEMQEELGAAQAMVTFYEDAEEGQRWFVTGLGVGRARP